MYIFEAMLTVEGAEYLLEKSSIESAVTLTAVEIGESYESFDELIDTGISNPIVVSILNQQVGVEPVEVEGDLRRQLVVKVRIGNSGIISPIAVKVYRMFIDVDGTRILFAVARLIDDVSISNNILRPTSFNNLSSNSLGLSARIMITPKMLENVTILTQVQKIISGWDLEVIGETLFITSI